MAATRNREIHIPLSIQLEAICLPTLQQTWLMLMPYLPELGTLNPRKDSEDAIRQVIKDHLAFESKDLLEYLGLHPEKCQALLQHSREKQGASAAFIEEVAGSQYRVGLAGAVDSQIQAFATLGEAAADYVLLTWGLPRIPVS